MTYGTQAGLSILEMNLDTAPVLMTSEPKIHNPKWICAFFAIAGLIWLLVARLVGPSDLWDHTQPKTISYTTDIIEHGGDHWILPIERGELPATKPPLYNWIAVPFVKLLGFNNELAHKFPSVIGLCLCWLVVVRLGRWIGGEANQALGWLAGLMLVANTTMFKLGYLARPDMLLTFWLLLAWVAATVVLIAHRQQRAKPVRFRWIALAFWACVALAGLTKGPAAIVAIMYALIAARVIGGSWRAIRHLYPLLGSIIALSLVGAWVYGVWRINPDHLVNELWFNEFIGRVTGLGDKGSHEGFQGWLIGLPVQLIYFLTRFLPWSLAAIAAMFILWRRNPDVASYHSRRWQAIEKPLGAWLCGAAIQVVIVIGLFTLSAGRRADYIAAAFPPGALLASWCVLQWHSHWRKRVTWLVPATAVICLAILTAINSLDLYAPRKGYGEDIKSFVNKSAAWIPKRPWPIAFCWVHDTHLQAVLGASEIDGIEKVIELLKKRKPFWVVAGRRQTAPFDLEQWLLEHKKKANAKVIVQSVILPHSEGWPDQVTLYKVTRAKSPAQPAEKESGG